VVLAVIIGTVLAGVSVYMIATAGEEDTDDAQITSDVVPVATRVAGQVVAIRIEENQIVKKGDLLAEIDDADYAARVRQAEAELSSAEAQAKSADAQVQVVRASSRGGFASAQAAVSGSSVGVSSASAQVAAAHAAVARAEADFHKTQIDLDRAKQLRAAHAIRKIAWTRPRSPTTAVRRRGPGPRAVGLCPGCPAQRRDARERGARPFEPECASGAADRGGRGQRGAGPRADAKRAGDVGPGAAATVVHQDSGAGRRLGFQAGGARGATGRCWAAGGFYRSDCDYVVANFKETQVGP